MDWLKHLLTILAYFFSPRVRRRREKERIYNQLKALERQYEVAMQESDPEAAGKLHAQMDEARERIKYLESRED